MGDAFIWEGTLWYFISHLYFQINFIIKPSVPLGKLTRVCHVRQISMIFRPPYRDISDNPILAKSARNGAGGYIVQNETPYGAFNGQTTVCQLVIHVQMYTKIFYTYLTCVPPVVLLKM